MAEYKSTDLYLVEDSALDYLVAVSGEGLANLDGSSGRFQVRESYDSVSTILSLDTAGGGVQFGSWSYLGHQYNVRIHAGADEVSGLPQHVTGVWDLMIEPDGDEDEAIRVAGGFVRFMRNAVQ